MINGGKGLANTVRTSTYRSSKDVRIYGDRLLEATLVILLLWGIVSWLHWQPQMQWLMAGLTALLSAQTVRMLIVKPTFPSIV